MPMQKTAPLFLVLATAVLSWGGPGRGSANEAAPPPKSAAAPEPTPVPAPGPAPGPVPPPALAKPTAALSGTVLSAAGVPPKRGVVYLEGALPSSPTPPERPMISQRGARFRPDFLVITVGQTVSMPNDDRIVHNVFSVSPAKRFDLGHYSQGEARSVAFDKPGIIELFCNIHENMQAVLVVAPSRFYSLVGEDGRWSIAEPPAGKYRLVAYSPELGQDSVAIELSPGGSVVHNFKLKDR